VDRPPVPPVPHGPGDSAPDVRDDVRLRRVVDVFRVVALGYAVGLYAAAHDDYRRPVAGWVVLAVLAGWTALLTGLDPRRRRQGAVMVVDLGLAAGSVVVTRWLDDPARIADGAQTLPVIWPAAAVLGWALWRGWLGGLVAALVVAVADLVELGRFSAWSENNTGNNIVLLVLAGLIVGLAAEVLRAGRAQMAAAVARQAATAERERLAGDIHDSVLQVLGFVHRDGTQRGGAAADLARLAGEQEARLRALISNGPAAPSQSGADGEADLRAALTRHAGARVSISCPAQPVLLPADRAGVVEAAAAAALDNVRRHAGAQARAWVLLEDEPGQVTVTVRDDGAGFEPGRLEAARADGRLGVSASIRGRIGQIGGTVEIISTPGEGTEIEMRVPRV
jgi:signal transduction histidine kinase